jgi:hypothetical protein
LQAPIDKIKGAFNPIAWTIDNRVVNNDMFASVYGLFSSGRNIIECIGAAKAAKPFESPSLSFIINSLNQYFFSARTVL